MRFILSFLLIVSAVFFHDSTPLMTIQSINEDSRVIENVSQPYGQVVIGTPSFSGNMIDGYGNDSSDVIVRNMIWGYATYTTTSGGEIVLDTTAVKKVTVTNDQKGNRTYLFELNPSLKWSDGKSITADDYVFSLLLQASPKWSEAGAYNNFGQELLGYNSYNSGASNSFAGVKKISSTSFSLTIDSSYTPYFYETLYVATKPYPMHVWGKGLSIGTDGSSLVGNLTVAIDYITNTERYTPTVTSGPFKFVSNLNKAITVKNNPYFLGDYRGHKAKLDTVVVKEIDQGMDVHLVIEGDVDIVTNVNGGYKIDVVKSSDKASFVKYYRNGYGMISFTNDFGPTTDNNYRKAVAHLINRQQFVDTILSGDGTIVNAEYGQSQWMYQAKSSELATNLINYSFNVSEANRLLNLTEWKYESDGKTLWNSSKAKAGYYRHNAAGVMLVHNHFGSQSNVVSELISEEWPKGMDQAGVKFNIEYGDFSALISNYYVETSKRYFHSYNLATNFSVNYDPYYSLNSDFYGAYYSNPTGTNNPEIDRLTLSMRSLNPNQKSEYLSYWVEYQKLWNKLLPILPTYVNSYYDVFNVRLSGLKTNSLWTVGRAIIDVSVAYDSDSDAVNLSSMALNTLPTKTSYLFGQQLDLVGGSVKLAYKDGSSRILALSPSMVTGYNSYSSIYGPQTITVTYAGKTTSFQVSLDRFSDVPYGHRNYAHINTLVELGIINGYSDSTFRPNNTLTRAQAAIMIARAIGLSTEGVSSNFSDVPSTHAAYKFISAAQNAGIINGYSDGTFRPNASITRAQIAIMVQRAFQVQASGTAISFTDVPVGYAPKSFIETLASQRIVNGYSDGTFKPTNNVTRAQFSTMINNAIEYSKKR